jgi:hypothetical protein
MNNNISTDETDNQKRLGRESEMQPLTTDSTRQPLQDKTLSELQNKDETGLPEDVDEAVQQSDPVETTNVVDRQIGIVNRPAG